MWLSRLAELPDVDVAAERMRVLARRAEAEKLGQARRLLAHSGQDAGPEQIEEISRTRHAHLPAEARSEIVERALQLVRTEQPTQPEESPVIKAAGGPKLTPEQREDVRAFVRRELLQDPSVSAVAVRKKLKQALGIALNNATFHGVYWRKVKAEMQEESMPDVAAQDGPAPIVGAASSNGREPQTPVAASPEEQIRIAPGPDGQWRVQVDVLASRAQALRLMQAIVGVLAAEE